jgi:hypothetical protein
MYTEETLTREGPETFVFRWRQDKKCGSAMPIRHYTSVLGKDLAEEITLLLLSF